MTSWQIYWLTRMDSLQGVFGIPGFIILIIAIIFTAVIFVDQEKLNKTGIKWAIIGGALLAISSFIPNTKEMAAIILIPKLTSTIASNEKIQELPNNLLNLANDWIKELEPKK